MPTQVAVLVRPPDELEQMVPEPSEQFVSTPQIQALTDRALAYLHAGCAIHFAGPAGTGKTTLAFHVAAQVGRPVVLLHGDDEFQGSDLLGRNSGYRRSKVVDNYIHSVLKTEENLDTYWVDHRLSTACENGYTLIYDEFNRSRPEANNTLLSVLEEKILNLPRLRCQGGGYLEVHRDFRAIFTSNPEEYAGVHKTQDALLDRMVTISLGRYDRETEIQVTVARSGISLADAETIVDIVRELRQTGVHAHAPTIRACIAIARILVHLKACARPDDPVFPKVCRDVLNVDAVKVSRNGQSLMPQKLEEALRKVTGGPRSKNPGRRGPEASD